MDFGGYCGVCLNFLPSYNDKGLPIAKAGIKAISELLSKNRERKGLPDAKEIIMHTPSVALRPSTLLFLLQTTKCNFAYI